MLQRGSSSVQCGTRNSCEFYNTDTHTPPLHGYRVSVVLIQLWYVNSKNITVKSV